MERWVCSLVMALVLSAGAAGQSDSTLDAAPAAAQTGVVAFENQERRRAWVISFWRCGTRDGNGNVVIDGRESLRIDAGETRRFSLPVGCYIASFGRGGLSFEIFEERVDVRPAAEGFVQITTEPRLRWIASLGSEQDSSAGASAVQAGGAAATGQMQYNSLSEARDACLTASYEVHMAGHPVEEVLALGAFVDTAEARRNDESFLPAELGLALMQFAAEAQVCYADHAAGAAAIDNRLSEFWTQLAAESLARAQAVSSQAITVGAYVQRRETEAAATREAYSRLRTELDIP